MAVHRERVDPQQDEEGLGLVHRRWILPDDLARTIALPSLSRLWRGLLELSVLNENDDVLFEQLPLPLPDVADVEAERRDIPAGASAGLLLAASGKATLLTQVVRLDEGHRDPYRAPEGKNGHVGEGEWHDYTLYAVDREGTWLLPIGLQAVVCGSCGNESEAELPWFGEAQLLELSGYSCPHCDAQLDPARDKAVLLNGDTFLLQEICCRAALSIELPEEPSAEEMPDAAVAKLLADAFGGTDELAHGGVEPA
jgi:hypothetical protein